MTTTETDRPRRRTPVLRIALIQLAILLLFPTSRHVIITILTGGAGIILGVLFVIGVLTLPRKK
jgi:hypothetical protein